MRSNGIYDTLFVAILLEGPYLLHQFKETLKHYIPPPGKEIASADTCEVERKTGGYHRKILMTLTQTGYHISYTRRSLLLSVHQRRCIQCCGQNRTKNKKNKVVIKQISLCCKLNCKLSKLLINLLP